MKTSRIFAAGALALAIPALAAAPEAVIKARQANFKQIGRANKMIGDELKKPSADIATIRANAPTLANLSGKLLTWFPRGTGKPSGIKTEAGPAIWTKPADFRAAAVKFNGAARALQTAAATGDVARIRPAAAAVGQACKGCHDSFRIKE